MRKHKKIVPKIEKKVDLRPVVVTDDTNIRQTFLQLTHRTCPEGYEDSLYSTLLIQRGFSRDGYGNYVRIVGNEQQSRIVFAAHMDTVGRTVDKVNHKFTDAGRFVGTDGKTILGADDKAGMTLLLYMLSHNIPGTYILFMGEEVGCLGSSSLVAATSLGQWDAMISFDRAGTEDIITHQAGVETCSIEFASALAAALNEQVTGFKYKPSDEGVYTDSNEFRAVVPECTNVSVGYYRQHGVNEVQDLEWLECLAYALVRVDWSTLPIVRVAKEEAFSWKGYHKGSKFDSSEQDDVLWGEYRSPDLRLRELELSSLEDIHKRVELAQLTEDDLLLWMELDPQNMIDAATVLYRMMWSNPLAVSQAIEKTSVWTGGKK